MLPPARSMSKSPPAAWSVSDSGTDMAGACAAFRFADPRHAESASRLKFEPGRCFCRVFFFIYVARILVAKPVSTFSEHALSRRADRTQHRFTRPAIDLQSRRFLVRPKRRAGLHPGLAVEFVLVETDARQVPLHGFDIGGVRLGRSRPPPPHMLAS